MQPILVDSDMEKRLAPVLIIVGWMFMIGGIVIMFSALHAMLGVIRESCISSAEDQEFFGHAIGAGLAMFAMISGWLFVRTARRVQKEDG
jgi:hypothetical protein